MSVIDKLASSLNRRDEVPNQKLAQQIVTSNDAKGVEELVDNLLNNKDKNIQSDCIKVLYEIGEKNPDLIAKYHKEFVAVLEHKNNRLVWGAMTALDTITLLQPDTVYKALPKLLRVVEKGSVITRDHYVGILIKLASIKKYADNVFPLFVEQLEQSPTNQLPMYAERSVEIINDKNQKVFVRTLAKRLGEVEKESKRKRIEKVIKKVSA